MLPVLSASQIRRLEVTVMERDSISALALMERAGEASAHRIIELNARGAFGDGARFVVLAGMGNNGGDGLVIARLLHTAGFQVRVVQVVHRPEPSKEHALNLDRLDAIGLSLDRIDHLSNTIHILENEVIIDSVFGVGLSRPLDGWLADLVNSINGANRPVVSIDLPSGMVPPEAGADFNAHACIHADHTLTFEVPRLGLLLPETGVCAGRFELLPIGLDPEHLAGPERLGGWVQATDLRCRLLQRQRFGHKGSFGHCLIGAGSRGMYGAAVLALKGCLRSGVGLVTGHVPSEAVNGLMSTAPDAMCSIDPCPDHLSDLPALNRFQAVALGPGCGQHADTSAMVERCLSAVQSPLVLDADALNILAMHPNWFDLLGPKTVLTPHPKEMDRLLGGASATSVERLRRTQAFAQRHRCTVVLKGPYTVTCTPEGELYFNSTGNVGMAKGGSGDVLTGLLAGLLAQGYGVLDACLIGVYLHGSAGDIAAAKQGTDAMRPSDLLDALPSAWQALRSASEQAV